jgi:hypothetical protein
MSLLRSECCETQPTKTYDAVRERRLRLTPYPFLHIFPQDQHERLLIERLGALGVAVERRTELISFTEGKMASRRACAGPTARS